MLPTPCSLATLRARCLSTLALPLLLTGCEVTMNGAPGSNAPADAGEAVPAATAASGAASSELPIAAAPTSAPTTDGGEVAAEGGSIPGEGGSTPVERNPPGTDFNPVGTDAERYACTSDADCVLTKWTDANCCPRLCRTNLALNKDFEAQLATEREASCERNCPVARCTKPTETYAVSCVENSCVVTASAISAPAGL